MNNWTKFKETTQIIPVLMLDCLVKDYGNFKKFHDGKTEIRRYGQFLSGRWMGQDDIKNYEKMMGAASLQTFVQMERETGFEPATACLEGRNSTAELLPLAGAIIAASRRGSWPSASRRTRPYPPRGRGGSSSARNTASPARGRCPASGHTRRSSQSSPS